MTMGLKGGERGGDLNGNRVQGDYFYSASGFNRKMKRRVKRLVTVASKIDWSCRDVDGLYYIQSPKSCNLKE